MNVNYRPATSKNLVWNFAALPHWNQTDEPNKYQLRNLSSLTNPRLGNLESEPKSTRLLRCRPLLSVCSIQTPILTKSKISNLSNSKIITQLIKIKMGSRNSLPHCPQRSLNNGRHWISTLILNQSIPLLHKCNKKKTKKLKNNPPLGYSYCCFCFN